MLLQMRLFCTGLVVLIGLSSKAQIKQLAIGDKFPATTVEVINDKAKTRTIGGLAGKHLILDFWATWCKPCVADLPKLDSIQHQYLGKLDLLPVNIENREKAEFLYEKLKKAKKFSLPSVVDRPELLKQFPFSTFPHLIWINDQGIIVAITDANELTKSNIEKFILNQPLSLKGKIYTGLKKSLSYSKPFLSQLTTLAIPETIAQFYSVLSKYDADLHSTLGGASAGNKYLSTNSTIKSLYSAAYGGLANVTKFDAVHMIIESKDSTKITYPKEVKNWSNARANEWNLENCYTYDIHVPVSRKSEIFDFMKQDLDRYFGYSVRIEKRKIRCFVLRSINPDLYTSKGGTVKRTLNQYYLKYNNVGVKWLTIDLNQYYQNSPYKVIDQTGFTGTLDIELKDVDFTTHDLVVKALEKVGFSLALEDIEQEVIIIGDKK